MKKLAIFLLFPLILTGGNFSRYTLEAKNIMIKKVTLLDSVVTHFWNFDEISDLAYDPTRDALYAINDSAWLYTLEIRLRNDRIQSLRLLHRRKLKGKHHIPLTRKALADSEGMCFVGGNLLVSFERRPRIALYTTKGDLLYTIKLPKPLRKKRLYRDKNQMLEAITYHPRYRIVTAPEEPLRISPMRRHTLYSEKTRWYFEATGSITALETTPKGNILVLERKMLDTNEFLLTLSRLNPTRCENTFCKTQKILQLHTDANFEGLTALKGNRYLLVDDSKGGLFRSDTRFILIRYDD